MKKEDIVLLVVFLFISIMIGCLAINGEVPDLPSTPVEFIDSEMNYDTIEDVRFLTNNRNNYEETCIRIRNDARTRSHIMWRKVRS